MAAREGGRGSRDLEGPGRGGPGAGERRGRALHEGVGGAGAREAGVAGLGGLAFPAAGSAAAPRVDELRVLVEELPQLRRAHLVDLFGLVAEDLGLVREPGRVVVEREVPRGLDDSGVVGLESLPGETVEVLLDVGDGLVGPCRAEDGGCDDAATVLVVPADAEVLAGEPGRGGVGGLRGGVGRR